MSYAVRNYFRACTDNHSATRDYPSSTTVCCTYLVLSRFPWELTVLPWRFQDFTPWFKIQPQPADCLNHTVIHKYITNAELYLTFSKYGDKSLVVKSLINILKFAYFNIVSFSFFCRYCWSNKQFKNIQWVCLNAC